MAYARLPESVHTLYAELLDQLRSADADLGIGGSGSFVSKQVRGRTYWYLQKSEGARKRQIYLGPESPDLLKRIDKAGEKVAAAGADDKHRRDLVSMLAAGGMVRESAAVGRQGTSPTERPGSPSSRPAALHRCRRPPA